jgi:O-antigen ligase
MIRDATLAIGLLLSTASQLRLRGLPIGAGELLLLAWSVWTFADKLTRRSTVVTRALVTVSLFWAIFAAAESLGLLNTLVRGIPFDPDWLLHDAMAYPLVAAVACACAAEPPGRLRRIAWLFAAGGALSLALQCAAAAGVISIPSVQPWYWQRMRGWSANPNQLAFLCTAIALLAIHLAATAASTSRSVAALLCLLLALVVGRLSGSDTFTLTLLVAVALASILRLRFSLLQPGPGQAMRMALGVVLLAGVPMLAAAFAPLVMSERSATAELQRGILKNGGKDAGAEADMRLALWQQAIERGVDAGMLGLGPGPHLAIPRVLVAARASEAGQPGNIEHPRQNGVPNFEAHNTLLDLFVQGGLIADLAILWLLGVALLAAYRARSASLVTLLCGITQFGLTNLIMRQPLFWFSIALCLAQMPLAKNIRASEGAKSRPSVNSLRPRHPIRAADNTPHSMGLANHA